MQSIYEHKNLFSALLIFMCISIMLTASCSKESFKDENNCDLGNVTYDNGINKILNNKCSYSSGCHFNNVETFDLSTYEGAKTAAGSIVNRINRDADDPLYMPQDKTELDPCELQSLRTWVSIGAPLK